MTEPKPIPTPKKVTILDVSSAEVYRRSGEAEYVVQVGLFVINILVFHPSTADETGIAVRWKLFLWGGDRPLRKGSVPYEPAKKGWNPVGEACGMAAREVQKICAEMELIPHAGTLWGTSG